MADQDTELCAHCTESGYEYCRLITDFTNIRRTLVGSRDPKRIPKDIKRVGGKMITESIERAQRRQCPFIPTKKPTV